MFHRKSVCLRRYLVCVYKTVAIRCEAPSVLQKGQGKFICTCPFLKHTDTTGVDTVLCKPMYRYVRQSNASVSWLWNILQNSSATKWWSQFFENKRNVHRKHDKTVDFCGVLFFYKSLKPYRIKISRQRILFYGNLILIWVPAIWEPGLHISCPNFLFCFAFLLHLHN